MQKSFIAATLALSFVAAHAEGEHGSADDAKKMADAAAALVKSAGEKAAFAEFNDPANKKWHVKDLYVFCYRHTGKVACHGSNPLIIGRDLSKMTTADGKLFFPALDKVAVEKSAGWSEPYKWQNPTTKLNDDKKSYIVNVPEIEGFVGVGVYLH